MNTENERLKILLHQVHTNYMHLENQMKQARFEIAKNKVHIFYIKILSINFFIIFKSIILSRESITYSIHVK